MEECHFLKNIIHSGIILQDRRVSFPKNSTFWNNTTGWRSVISKNIVDSGIILQDGGVSFPKKLIHSRIILQDRRVSFPKI